MTTKQLHDNTTYVKATHHNDKTLKGRWQVTLKIDGVRAIRDSSGAVLSRNSKPLYNLSHLEFQDAEIFRKDWETSVSLVRTQSYRGIFQEDVYELRPGYIDPRLETDIILTDPTFEERILYMKRAVAKGYEGIVLRKLPPAGSRRKVAAIKWVKVVPKMTIDIRITGFNMSDKRKGYIKNFTTNWGNISATGFPIEELEVIKSNGAESYVGKIAETEFREWTKNKKMRFVNWVRWRFDKDEESLT